VTTTYSPTGQVATQTDGRGLTQYQYDERDRLLLRTDPDGRTIAYTYDAAGNRLSVASAAGTTQYAYDALNRLTSASDRRGGATQYAYDLAGNLLRTTLPNGVVDARAYDALNRPRSVVHSAPGSDLSGFQYTFDPAGRRTSVLEQSGRRTDYTYDLAGRLLSESTTAPGSAARSIAYTYDAVGNRLTRTDSAAGQTTYEYDANDRLIRESTQGDVTTYTYDANGNTLSISGPSEQKTFVWDAENRLVQLTTVSDTQTHQIAYRYNASGLRVSQSIDGRETRFLVDELLGSGEVLEEYELGGNILAAYTHGVDLIAQERAGQRAFFHTDGQQSVASLTDLNAAATDRYFYEAYGRLAERSGNTANAYLYRGEQFDPHADAYYLRARYYDHSTGRLLSADPFVGGRLNPTSLHRYLYASNDPVNRIDPTGRSDANLTSLMTANAGQHSLFTIGTAVARGLVQRVFQRLAHAAINQASRMGVRQASVTLEELALEQGAGNLASGINAMGQQLARPLIQLATRIPQAHRAAFFQDLQIAFFNEVELIYGSANSTLLSNIILRAIQIARAAVPL
jgi:RHS repeat-associated protein